MLQKRWSRSTRSVASVLAVMAVSLPVGALQAQTVVLEHFTLIDGTGRAPTSR
jgi:hypothetical protein